MLLIKKNNLIFMHFFTKEIHRSLSWRKSKRRFSIQLIKVNWHRSESFMAPLKYKIMLRVPSKILIKNKNIKDKIPVRRPLLLPTLEILQLIGDSTEPLRLNELRETNLWTLFKFLLNFWLCDRVEVDRINHGEKQLLTRKHQN